MLANFGHLGAWWCFVGSVRGIQLRHRQQPPQTNTIPPKRSPPAPWPSRRNNVNSKNKISFKTLIPMAGKPKRNQKSPKIIQKYLSKKLIPMAGTPKRSRARLKRKGLPSRAIWARCFCGNAELKGKSPNSTPCTDKRCGRTFVGPFTSMHWLLEVLEPWSLEVFSWVIPVSALHTRGGVPLECLGNLRKGKLRCQGAEVD